jgi:signal transduction histidine kinase
VTPAGLMLMGIWAIFAACLYAPDSGNGHMLSVLVLACTLAASGTMLSVHAATGAGAIFASSALLLAVEFANGYHKQLRLFELFVIYVVMVVAEAYVIHRRFVASCRLEQDREALIVHLRHAHESTVAAARAKSEFLANMSHELRTPLNAIIGFSDIVRTKALGDAGEKYTEYADFIHQSGRHLLDLIGDVLDLAKIDAGNKVLNEEPLDLAGLILDETAAIATITKAKGTEALSVLPDRLPLLRADPYAIRKILHNLLSNAVKFTPPGGRVEVSARLNADREMEFFVADTGLGMTKAEQQIVFDRFGANPPEVTAAGRGSGLGLAIVKGLADMHGARIALDSAPGEGTRIGLVFPAARTVSYPDSLVA